MSIATRVRNVIAAAVIAAAVIAAAAIPALAVLGLGPDTQNSLNNLLATVATLPDPSLAQRRAAHRVERKSAKAFRTGRSRSDCINDIKKIIKAAGTLYDDEIVSTGQGPVTGASLRTTIVNAVFSDVEGLGLNAAVVAGSALDDLSEKQSTKLAKPLGKAAAALGQARALLGDEDLSPKEACEVLKLLVKAMKFLEKSDRKARKFGVPISLFEPLPI